MDATCASTSSDLPSNPVLQESAVSSTLEEPVKTIDPVYCCTLCGLDIFNDYPLYELECDCVQHLSCLLVAMSFGQCVCPTCKDPIDAIDLDFMQSQIMRLRK